MSESLVVVFVFPVLAFTFCGFTKLGFPAKVPASSSASISSSLSTTVCGVSGLLELFNPNFVQKLTACLLTTRTIWLDRKENDSLTHLSLSVSSLHPSPHLCWDNFPYIVRMLLKQTCKSSTGMKVKWLLQNLLKCYIQFAIRMIALRYLPGTLIPCAFSCQRRCFFAYLYILLIPTCKI